MDANRRAVGVRGPGTDRERGGDEGVAPLVSLSHFSNEILLDLNAGDTVSLQMFGIASVATLLPGSAGASLTILRLS